MMRRMLNMRRSQVSRRVAKPGMIILPKTGDRSGRLCLRVDVSAAIAQPCPFGGRSYFECGSPPAANRPHAADNNARERRKPWQVSNRGMSIVGPTETQIGDAVRVTCMARADRFGLERSVRAAQWRRRQS